MPKTLRLLALPMSLTLLIACAPTIGQHFRERALDRVAFELKCPKADVEVLPLDLPLDHAMASGAHVGVKGCGQQAVYVFTNQTGWVANTEATVAEPTP